MGFDEQFDTLIRASYWWSEFSGDEVDIRFAWDDSMHQPAWYGPNSYELELYINEELMGTFDTLDEVEGYMSAVYEEEV